MSSRRILLTASMLLVVSSPAYAQDILLKGTATKQNVGTRPKSGEKALAQPSSAFIEKYGEAARSPKVEAALKSRDNLTKEQQARKAASDRFEAEMKGVWVPGSSPIMAIMNGYMPPNMPQAQAIMLSQLLPKIQRTAQPMSPNMVSRMPGRPFDASSGMPLKFLSPPLRGIPMQRIPESGFDLRGTPNIYALMDNGSRTSEDLSRVDIAAQNQRLAQEALRARYGPAFIPPLKRAPGRNRQEQQSKTSISNDHQGSIVGVTDSLGNEVSSIQYDPWGNEAVLYGGSVMPTFGYQGMYKHDRSGLYLTMFRAYDPKFGRWLSKDPIGAGANLYAFVGNDPIAYVDPLGLWPGEAFSTPREAAVDALRGYNPQSIGLNREVAGSLYYNPISHTYHSTKGRLGIIDKSWMMPVPNGMIKVGGWHTHGAYFDCKGRITTRENDVSGAYTFSPTDLKNGVRRRKIDPDVQYFLGNPSGQWFMDDGGKIIGPNNLPPSPSNFEMWPIFDNNNDVVRMRTE